eukprot:Rhum_TRINITY_DN2239_c0_g1::Rhum_TRINITY_DN2239_c0_g1_i1::g.6277::m.6277
MGFKKDLGVQLSRLFDRHAGDAESARIAVCTEVGVSALEDVPAVLERRASALLGPEAYAHLVAMSNSIFEMTAGADQTVAPTQLRECYDTIAAMTSKSYGGVDTIVAYQAAGEPGGLSEAELCRSYLLGPVACNEFPPHWYRPELPPAALRVHRYGVTKDHRAVAVRYAMEGARPRTSVFRPTPPLEGGAGEDALGTLVAVVHGHTRHLLTEAQRAELEGRIKARMEVQWESVEVDEEPVNLREPDWNTLKHGTDNVDLQRVPETLLDAFKEKMEDAYQEHVIQPGDPRYRRDVRQDFAPPSAANEWDDSSD